MNRMPLYTVVAPPTAVVRVPWAARAVAVAGYVGFALDDDAVTVAIVAVDEECQEEGQEEEDAVPAYR